MKWPGRGWPRNASTEIVQLWFASTELALKLNEALIEAQRFNRPVDEGEDLPTSAVGGAPLAPPPTPVARRARFRGEGGGVGPVTLVSAMLSQR